MSGADPWADFEPVQGGPAGMTSLAPAQEAAFRGTWAPEVARLQGRSIGDLMRDQQDYDLRAAYRAGAMPDADGHLTDLGKLPNHPTFSEGSVYSTPAQRGGRWMEDGRGNDLFSPAPTNLRHRSLPEMRQYFRERERPGARVLTPRGVTPIQGWDEPAAIPPATVPRLMGEDPRQGLASVTAQPAPPPIPEGQP